MNWWDPGTMDVDMASWQCCAAIAIPLSEQCCAAVANTIVNEKHGYYESRSSPVLPVAPNTITRIAKAEHIPIGHS